MAGRASFEWDYSDDTTVSLIYENTTADDNRLRAARQFVSKIHSSVVAHLKLGWIQCIQQVVISIGLITLCLLILT